MTSLSLIETEAQELVKRLPEPHCLALQVALVELCEAHWHTLRGPQPTTRLAQTLWLTTPPLADLLIDLYAISDTRLNDVLPRYDLARGLALLVLAEIQRGDEFGIHIAHEPMKAFETVSPPASWLNHITSLLHGTLDAHPLHHHERHDALWKALAVIASHTKRLDLPAVLQIIYLLIESPAQPAVTTDAALEKLRHDVEDAGIRFLKIENDSIYFEQHHHIHKPVRTRQLGELLLEIRQQWLR
ncbi:hypothetical protein [Nitrosomonas sp. Is37]|uniref:hypothetical protein n=1 Tax=Nitrosomonas sp. Is37 TaxID=3080535 RepID=UPI00294AC5B8|nr:hypothetical protein [Nitrosomonas sp. Is37]MDV6343985.1 hypothetical protein [Nitrosomonas sp. Is37]